MTVISAGEGRIKDAHRAKFLQNISLVIVLKVSVIYTDLTRI